MTAAPNATEKSQSSEFLALLEEYTYSPPRRGQILESTILQTTDHEIIVDVGLKRDAIVPARDLEYLDEDFRSGLSRGDTVKVEVLRPYSPDGDLVVSINRALALADWEQAEQYMAEGTVVEAEIIGKNRGGMLTRFGRLRGFVPNSHVAGHQRSTPGNHRDDAQDTRLNEKSYFKIIEVDRMRNRLVMSEKEAQHKARLARLTELEQGQEITGPIVHIVNFGAFVDLGGVDGLIHISRLAHEHIKHPSEVVSLGEEVTVRIENIDIENERIGLNRRVLLPSPWDNFASKYEAEQLITGTITNVVEYGIFVQIVDGIQGLAHISNMSNFGFSNPNEMFREGEEVLVRIINIDAERGRVALSTDAVTLEEQQEWLHSRHATEDSEDTLEATAADEAGDEDTGTDEATPTPDESLTEAN